MPEDEEFVSGGVPIQTVPGLADLLNEISTAISDYVHLTNVEQNWAITLWTAHTHAIDYARITPRLAIKAPTRQSGKTRMMETLRPLVKDGWHIEGPSAATLYRNIQRKQPTILLDEVDRLFEKRAEDKAELCKP